MPALRAPTGNLTLFGEPEKLPVPRAAVVKWIRPSFVVNPADLLCDTHRQQLELEDVSGIEFGVELVRAAAGVAAWRGPDLPRHIYEHRPLCEYLYPAEIERAFARAARRRPR